MNALALFVCNESVPKPKLLTRPNSFAFFNADGFLVSAHASGDVFGKKHERKEHPKIVAGFFHVLGNVLDNK
jgi:hypothetical protein